MIIMCRVPGYPVVRRVPGYFLSDSTGYPFSTSTRRVTPLLHIIYVHVWTKRTTGQLSQGERERGEGRVGGGCKGTVTHLYSIICFGFRTIT